MNDKFTVSFYLKKWLTVMLNAIVSMYANAELISIFENLLTNFPLVGTNVL